MKKWQMIKESIEGNAKLWLNNQTGEYSIWCNKAEVIPARFTVKTTQEDAEKLFNEYLTEKANRRLTLPAYLALNNISLTDLEISCLHSSLSQGSFYEESAQYDENIQEYYVDRSSGFGACIGYEIYEDEVPGCRGAIASLVKKGILTVQSDDVNGEPIAMYITNLTLVFKDEKQFGYHVLDLDLH